MFKKVVVFDLDDTLYKEIDFLKSAFRHIAFLVSNVNVSEKEVYQMLIDTYYQGGNAFETVIRQYGFRLFDFEWMLSVYRNHKPCIKMDFDTKRTLDELKSAGVIMGIISDGRLLQQQNKIDSLGLSEYMDACDIIINSEVNRFKPDERCYRYFMDRYGEDSDYCYVGDNISKDFITPNTLGWSTICLLDDGRNIHKQNFNNQSKFLPKKKIKKISEML